jgi:hypothetical protein
VKLIMKNINENLLRHLISNILSENEKIKSIEKLVGRSPADGKWDDTIDKKFKRILGNNENIPIIKQLGIDSSAYKKNNPEWRWTKISGKYSPNLTGMLQFLRDLGAKKSGKPAVKPAKATKKHSKKMAPKDFISKFGPIIKAASPGSGIFPSVTLAQAILETGWGRSTVGDANNMFGIKAKGSHTEYWQGESTTAKTTEYIKGKKGTYNLGFRKYDSLEDSIKDHNLLLQKSRYKKAVAAKTPEDQAFEIKAAGYATDPRYAKKLVKLIDNYNLKQFDTDMVKEKGSVEAGS